MDDDSCEFKYIEIVPLDSNVEQTEDLKPFEVKVCFITNLVNHESKLWSSGSILACGARGPTIEPILYTVLCFHIAMCSFVYGLHIYCSA